jgi:histidyl-tRNA synthetase
MAQGDLSREPYRGVRDFYPADFAARAAIFEAWRKAARAFGYQEYDASVLEPTELYVAKSSQEIVSEQTYTFTDRGDRSVTLRPEMTPTVARMVAARRRDLGMPVRWFSIPNLFRYEAPQRGRVREHWQWNVDVFGIANHEAEAELIEVAVEALRKLGLPPEEYEVRLNDRAAVEAWLAAEGISGDRARAVVRVLDRRAKLSADDFAAQLREAAGKEVSAEMAEPESVRALRETLAARGIANARYAPEVVRGFDYYTGIVFEFFDRDARNPRALAGGGRYDRLLEAFGEPGVPTAGFGMGETVLQDALEVRGAAPDVAVAPRAIVIPVSEDDRAEAWEVARAARRDGASVAVDWTPRKLGDKLAAAAKQGSKYAAIIGEKERATGSVTLRNLVSGDQSEPSKEDLARAIAL